MPAGPPPASTPLPAVVASIAGGEPTRFAWGNGLGGLTVAVGDPPTRYVKWQPHGSGEPAVDLAREAERLRWAAAHLTVPEVLDLGRDDEAAWLVTRAIDATSAVDERWKADPAPSVRAIGAGLRHLHDTLPVDDCPWTWSVEDRLGRLQPEFEHRRADLADAPAVDRLVVCHGDACAPNTLVDAAGTFTGHCDLAMLGLADRWADLAVASMSLEWNFGPGWEDEFFAAYGIDPDPDRIAYHRELWNST